MADQKHHLTASIITSLYDRLLSQIDCTIVLAAFSEDRGSETQSVEINISQLLRTLIPSCPSDIPLSGLVRRLEAHYRASEFVVESQHNNTILKICWNSQQVAVAKTIPEVEPPAGINDDDNLKTIKRILGWRKEPSLAFCIEYNDGTIPAWQPLEDVCEWSESEADWIVTEKFIDFLNKHRKARKAANEVAEKMKPGFPVISVSPRTGGCGYLSHVRSESCGKIGIVNSEGIYVCPDHLCPTCNQRMQYFKKAQCWTCAFSRNPSDAAKRPRDPQEGDDQQHKKSRFCDKL